MLVPMDQMMEYVDFTRPGDYKILATVVWNPLGDIRVLKKRIFGGKIIDGDTSKNFSAKRVLDANGEFYLYDGNDTNHKFAVCSLDETASIEVNVAKEFFAKPPSKFEKFWVNFWFERKTFDQCQFRRRRILAYTIQPFVVLPYLLCKTIFRSVVALFLLLCGIRGVNLRPLIHPWAMETNDIWWDAQRSIFIATKDGKDRKYIVVACEVCNAIDDNSSNIMGVILVGLVVVIAIWFGTRHPLAVAAIAGLVGLAWLTSRLMTKKTRDFEALPGDERKRILLERLAHYQESITCNGPMVARYDALPQEKRTFYLRYREIKAKVCKQFAG
jgi:hypothetical protein